VNKALVEAEDPSLYPNYPYSQTLAALCSFWSKVNPALRPANFRMYAGSVGALDSICRLFAANGSIALGYSPQFTEFKTFVTSSGGLYEPVPLDETLNYKFDENTLIEAISDRHSLIYIDNPNNPTGQVINLAQIEKILVKAVKMGVAVLVDEAYADYIDDCESAIALLHKYDNLLVARSFSKGYGLAGLRVGYAVCSEELQQYLWKAGMPFTVTSRNAKAAVTALMDQAFLAYSRDEVLSIKSKVLSSLRTLSVMETDPRTPILTLKDPSGSDLYKKLLGKGILTERGQEVGLNSQFVRLRVHRQSSRMIELLNRS
jgi:histidinol-phosphate aminotransferase